MVTTRVLIVRWSLEKLLLGQLTTFSWSKAETVRNGSMWAAYLPMYPPLVSLHGVSRKKTDWVTRGGMAFNLLLELALTAATKNFPG